MSLTNNHFTIILGIDIHFNTLPPFNPLHPFIGLVLDPMDYIPFIGATVQVNGRKRGVSDTSGMLVFLRHFPLFTGPFVETPFIAHESVNFFGAQHTYAQDRMLSPTTYLKMTCNDIGIPLSLHPGKNWKPIPSLFAPTSFSIPVPTGPPVNLGGPFVPDLMGLLINLVASYGFGALLKGAGRLMSKAAKKAGEHAGEKLSVTMGKVKQRMECLFDPVDMANGRVVFTGEDFRLPGMLPLVWERYWYSDSRVNGLLGHGNTCLFDTKLLLMPEEDLVAVLLPDGRAAGFDQPLPGGQVYNRIERSTLTHAGDHYTLFNHDTRLTYVFQPQPGQTGAFRLATLRNEQGFAINAQWHNDMLEQIEDSAGRVIKVDSDAAGRIVRMVLQELRGKEQVLVSYTYNAAGDLEQIIDALGQPEKQTYKNHLLVKSTDRNGQSFYWEYDGNAPGARCVHTWGDGGLLEGFITYHDGYNVATDALGRSTTFYYDENQLIIQVTDPEGHNRFKDYTEFEELYRVVDEEGNVTGYRYDERGNMVAEIRPDNSTCTFVYDEEDRVVMLTDAEGASTVRNYNAVGQLQSVIHPDNGMLHYDHDAYHRLVRVRDDAQQETRLQYDEANNLSDVTLPDGSHTHWDYDGRGQCIRRVNPQGGVQSFVYDALGRVTRIQQADGNIIWLDYNAYEDVVHARDSQHDVQYNYTPLGSVTRRQEKNTAVRFAYNAFDELLSITNEQEERNSFFYNKRGDLVSQRYFDGSVRNYERLDNGWLRKMERPGGRFTQYEYDGNGRMVRVEHSDGSWELYNYDRNGLMSAAINEAAAVYITRDALGRIVNERSVVNGQTYEVESKFNRLGQRSGLKSSLGAQLDLSYNKIGKISGLQARHNDDAVWTANMQYNELGLETERWLPGGLVNLVEYDRAGLPYRHAVKVNNRMQRRHQYSWNANQRLVTLFNEVTNGMVNFGHDDFANLAWAEYEDGQRQYRAPDVVGNLYRTPARGDRRYDAGGQLVLNEGRQYRYDEEGNLVSREEGLGRYWTYQWYGNGLLQKVERPDGAQVTFEYDALSRRISKCFAPALGPGRLTRWVWDDDNILHEWEYPADQKPQLRVNATGDLVASHPEPVDQLVTWIFNEGENSPAAKLQGARCFSVINDYLGTPVEMYDESGVKVWEQELDIYGQARIFGKGERTDCPFRYQGQYEDVETGLYYNRHRYYNPSDGVYISKDPIELMGNNPTAYGYVYDPNAWIDVYGLKCWATAKKDYWKGKYASEVLSPSGKYSARNLNRMKEGLAPRFKAEVFSFKKNAVVTKDISMELHHTYLPQRMGTEKAHDAWNLTEATPWAHEAMDEYRHTGSELIKIITGTNKW